MFNLLYLQLPLFVLIGLFLFFQNVDSTVVSLYIIFSSHFLRTFNHGFVVSVHFGLFLSYFLLISFFQFLLIFIYFFLEHDSFSLIFLHLIFHTFVLNHVL